ncbi:hypothetical protein KP509_14G004300 [Ceratopteris richardii]|uniref:Protein kinase domain-containing protein n=1 Tax=Ceratopteris richardii TaxID=49495 RepID=A0A8T2T921_CERRI|nr:hypothetical protein KP509_14G004300 [Ceratopteris richardii]
MKKQTRSGKACCSALEERFEVIRVLGSGTSGSLVACKTSHAHCPIPSNNRRIELKASGLLHMAVKLLRHAFPRGKQLYPKRGTSSTGIGIDEDACIRHEIDMMRAVQGSENVLPLHSFDSSDGFAHLITQFFSEGSLLDIVLRNIHSQRQAKGGKAATAKPLLPEPDTAAVVASVANALVLCHSHGLVHRDVKLENVFVHDKVTASDTARTCSSKRRNGPLVNSSKKKLLQKEDIFLADFGVADLLAPQEPVLKGHAGTPMYMAPEVLQGRPYDHHADIWSLGALMHLLLTGLPLPAHGKPHPLVQDYGAWDLLVGMLSSNPADRLTAEQVLSRGWIATWVSSS